MFGFRQLLIIAVWASLSLAQRKPAIVQYAWTHMNFTWPSVEAYKKAVADGTYNKEKNAISGIQIWKNRLYLTIPRLKFGVPATLLVTSLNSLHGNKSPNLEPYPNWNMQREGDCSAFQMVQGIKIDPLGRMWVIDAGRVGIFTDNPKNYCPARLVIFDLENNDEILLNYIFPENVTRRDTAYLNDIVLDHEDGGYAYISNADAVEPSIVVFSLKERKSWKINHKSMEATAVNFTIKYDGTKIITPVNIDGIALSPASLEGHRLLYYSPLSSYKIFTIPTSILKHEPSNFESHYKLLGKKPSQTDGMMMTANGKLYFGLLADNSVSSWNSHRPPFDKNQRVKFEDNLRLQWPDSFAIDQKGNLWCVSNRLAHLVYDSVNINETNYRVLLLSNVNSKSYQYYEDGRAPKLPMINA